VQYSYNKTTFCNFGIQMLYIRIAITCRSLYLCGFSVEKRYTFWYTFYRKTAYNSVK